jgi:uncharacterized protein
MPFGRKKNKGGEDGSTRLFFATDLHASEMCFRKLMAAGEVYETSTIIMGGDCTGKQLVCVVMADDGDRATCRWAGQEVQLRSEAEIAAHEKSIRNAGCYPVRLSTAQLREMEENAVVAKERFLASMLETVGEWVELAESRLRDKQVHMIMTPGNDDEFGVDDVLRASEYVDAAEGRLTRIGRHELLSVGWSNPTPWNTPRECSEDELASKIEAMAGEIEDMENAIFNIHVPPYATGLDDAPKLDEKGVPSGTESAPVGSTAVREAIARHQPLLSLHGHIHESRAVQKLGRTMCINPGSVYGEGMLQGVVVDLEPGKVKRYSLTLG